MNNVFVYVAHANGQADDSALELVSAAQTMFGELDDDGDLKKHKFLYTVGLGFTY